VAALVRRRVAADMGGPQAEELADAIIEVGWGGQAYRRAGGQAGGQAAGLWAASQAAARWAQLQRAVHQCYEAACAALQAAEARAARQPLGKRPHTVEDVLMAGGAPAGLSSSSCMAAAAAGLPPPLPLPAAAAAARCRYCNCCRCCCTLPNTSSNCFTCPSPPAAAAELEHRESPEGRPHERHSLASRAQVWWGWGKQMPAALTASMQRCPRRHADGSRQTIYEQAEQCHACRAMPAALQSVADRAAHGHHPAVEDKILAFARAEQEGCARS
jgi:hypothetical protein